MELRPIERAVAGSAAFALAAGGLALQQSPETRTAEPYAIETFTAADEFTQQRELMASTLQLNAAREAAAKAREQRIAQARAQASRSRKVTPTDTNLDVAFSLLAGCEATNNPRAVSPSGEYTGLYQFDKSTWISNGGGEYAPIAGQATAAAQTRIAKLLQSRRGWRPWPACSKKLRLQARFPWRGAQN